MRNSSPCELVIFDMDGTLTRPNLDFDAIRAAIGLQRGPILEALMEMGPHDRCRADAILCRFEDEAAENSELQPGAAETMAALRTAGLPVALMTRNSARSVEIVRRRHRLNFDFIRTRDDGTTKPAPDSVLDICRALGAPPSATWVIGDYHYDLLCANAAGAISVLYAADYRALPDWAAEATHVVHSLTEFVRLVGASSEYRSRHAGPE